MPTGDMWGPAVPSRNGPAPRRRTVGWGRRARIALAIAAAPVLAAGMLAAQLGSPAGAATHRYTATRECNPAKQECPPECLTAVLTTPAGRAYVQFCGTGSGGETPLREARWARTLTLDGSRVISHHSCPRSAPCVLLAPLSPPS